MWPRHLLVAGHQRDLTTFNRNQHGARHGDAQTHAGALRGRHGEIRLGFMSFFVKAAVHALKKFPVLNASVDVMT
ncbi:MAG: 2-oxo acid dehydrogenase subunit E2 [Burkholderiaceae bacterium]